MKKIGLLLLLVLTLVGCSGTSKPTNRLVFEEKMIQMTIDSIEIEELPEGTEIIFKLWGYDAQVADVKATLLNEYKYKLSELPVTYGLNYEKEWKKKIEPGKSGNYGYFVTLEVKNKDDKVYKIDYDSTDKDYFGTKKTTVDEISGRIFIKELK